MEEIRIFGNYLDAEVEPQKIDETFLSSHSDSKTIEKQIWSFVLNQQNLLICHGKLQIQDIEHLLHALPAFINKSSTAPGRPSVLMLSGHDTCFEVFHKNFTDRQCSISQNSEDAADILFSYLSDVPKLTASAVANVRLIIILSLDEALAKGTYGTIDKFLAKLQTPTQFMLLTSSMDIMVRIFIEAQLVTKQIHYMQIIIGGAEQTETTIQQAKHAIIVCKKYDKIIKLTEILASITRKADSSKSIVFVKPDEIDDVYSYLLDKEYPVIKEEKEYSPDMVANIWSEFAAVRTNKILITHSSSSMLQKQTPVQHVIIHDFPTDETSCEFDYLFQISLAGYSPNGQSYLLYCEKDLPRAQELIDIKNELRQPIEPELYTLAEKQIAMQSVPRRRLTVFEVLPEVSEEVEVKLDKDIDAVCLDPKAPKEVTYAEQYVEVVQSQGKEAVLKILLAKYLLHTKNESNAKKLVIFAQNDKIKNLTAIINNSISDKARMAVGLANNAGPGLRKKILEEFHKSDQQTLVTNGSFFEKIGEDLASIGLIINYDFPQTMESYKRQIGNTKSGVAKMFVVNFFTPENAKLKSSLVKFLEETKQDINPALMSDLKTFKQPKTSVGNLAALYAAWSSDKPSEITAEATEPSLVMIPSKVHQIPQFVEILSEDKENSFLNLIKFVLDHEPLPKLKMVVFISSAKIAQMKEILQNNLVTSKSDLHLYDLTQKSNAVRREVINANDCGLFFTPISILEEQIIEDVHNVNFVVHFNFPKYGESYLKSLRLIKTNGFAITFFVPQNCVSLQAFDEVLRKMNQPVNPLLEKIANKSNAKKIQNILENEKPTKIGNIAAFMDYTESQIYLEIKAALKTVQSIDVANVHQFVEVVAEDKMKSHKLCEILDTIIAHKQLKKFKMLIFAKSERLTVLSKMLTGHYKFPIFQVSLEFGGQILAQIVKTFRHGVLLIETDAFDTLQQTTNFDMSSVNFIIMYDFLLKNYVDALSKLQPKIDSFCIALLTPKNSAEVDQLISILREMKQKINPLLFAMQQNASMLFEHKLSAKQTKTGNVLAFISFLTNTQQLKCPEETCHVESRKKQKKSEPEPKVMIDTIIDLTNQEDVIPEPEVELIERQQLRTVAQFVEVLVDEEKPVALMHLINHMFCDDKKYAESKILVFATLPHIDKLYDYLNTNGKQLNKKFPTIFTIPEGATATVRERLLSLYKHGIFLISPYNFVHTMHQTGIEGVRCVVNYDFPKAKTAMQKPISKSTETLDSLEEIYLKRISNVNLMEKSCAVTFFSHNDLPAVATLIRVLMANDQKVNPLLVYMDSLDSANRQKNVISLNDPDTMKKIQDNTRDIRNHLSVGNMAAMYAYMNVKISSAAPIFGSPENVQPSPGPSRSSHRVELPQRVTTPSSQTNERNERTGRQFVEFMLDEDRGMTLLNLLHHITVRRGINDIKILIFCDGSKITELAEYIQRKFVNSPDREKYPTILAITGFENDATCHQILNRFQSQNHQLLIVFDEFFMNLRSGFPGVNLVINFDFPMVGNNASMVYRHRVSSVTMTGNVITFFTPRNIDYLKALISDLCQMKQVINPTLRAIQMANNQQELQFRMQNALDVRQSISVGNIEDFFDHLQRMPPLAYRDSLRPLHQHQQFTEVLPESSKRETLSELFRYMLQLDTYKNIKIIVFVRSLTIEKIKEMDGLLHNEMMCVLDRYPNFNRNYAHRNSDENVILRNTKSFITSTNGVLITDVDANTLGVRNTDFLIFYDCINRVDKHCEFYELLEPANSTYTVFVTFLTPNDRFLSNDFLQMLQRYEQPINPLIVQLVDAHISDAYLRTLRRSVTVGNLSALYQSSCSGNPSVSATIIENKIPKSISNLLERYVNKRLQTTIIPSMFSDADLLAITKNSDETTMALLIAAVGLTMQEQVQTSEPLILIFTRTLETMKKIDALIRMFNGILQKDGIHIDLSVRIIVGLVGQFCGLDDDQRIKFRNCKYAIFDQFDQLIRLGPVNGLYDIFNSRCQSNQLAIKVFSAEYSVYEKLLSLLYLKKDHHFYNAESDGGMSNNFSNVQQYFEMKNLGKDRKQSLIEVLQQISNVDISGTYTIVIFFNDNDAALQIAYQNLILDLPKIVQQVFCKKTFNNNFDSVLYWAKMEQQPHPIFLTNDARDLQNVKNVKYIINYDFPTGRFALLEYLQRMRHIKSKSGFSVSYFGFKDFVHSSVLVKLLEHMKQPINPLFLIIREKNFNHNTFAQELTSMSMSSSSIGDLTDFFMALCLMDHAHMGGDEDGFKRKSLEHNYRVVKRPCRSELNGRGLVE